MGIILKENNIYTKRRHDKFLSSSKYRYNQGRNTIYKKVKLKPNIPISEDKEDAYLDFKEEISQYLGTDSIIEVLGREPHYIEPEKETKKTEYKLNKKKVREKCSAFFGLKQSKKFILAFYSISFPQNFPDEFAYQCFNTVKTRMRKECGLKSYLWVAEHTKYNLACCLSCFFTFYFFIAYRYSDCYNRSILERIINGS